MVFLCTWVSLMHFRSIGLVLEVGLLSVMIRVRDMRPKQARKGAHEHFVCCVGILVETGFNAFAVSTCLQWSLA